MSTNPDLFTTSPQLPQTSPQSGGQTPLPHFPTSLTGKGKWEGEVGAWGRKGEEDGRPVRLSEQFHPTTCPQCHQITLHGYTDAGLTQHLNPTPLTPTTELAILTQPDGRTYQMNRNREAIWRDASKIRYYPAGNHPTYAVFAAHHCGQHIADQLTTWCWETPTHTPTSQEPQF